MHCRVAQPVGGAWGRLVIVHGYGEHVGLSLHGQFAQWMAARGVAREAFDQLRHEALANGPGAGLSGGGKSTWSDLESFLAAHDTATEPSRRGCPCGSWVTAMAG